MIASSIYNANPLRTSDSKVVTPADFFPGLAPPREIPPQTLEEQIKILTAVMGCGPRN